MTPGPGLVFALVPMVDEEPTRRAIEDLVGLVARAVALPIETRFERSPEALARLVGDGGADVAWVSPTLLLTAPGLARTAPLVSTVRERVTWFHGVIFVSRDAPYRTPLDLRGKRMAWVAPSSAAGYIFPRIALAGLGIDPSSHFAEERFFHTHDGVVRAVLNGEADAGAVFAVFEGGSALGPMKRSAFHNLDCADACRVIMSSAPIASDLVVATERALELAPSLPTVLVRLARDPRGPELLTAAFNAETFALVDPGALEELRRQVQDARDLGVL